MDCLINIAPPERPVVLYTPGEVREAGKNGMVIWLDLGARHAPARCRLAATVSGWVTAVGDGGYIYQDWAGAFTVGGVKQ